MASVQVRVTRGPWLSQLDQRFGGTPDNFVPNYEDALRRLQASDQPTLQQLATERVGEEAAAHFNDDWLENWWPEAQPIEPILRAGLIEALQRGLAARLPLSALWVQTGDSSFEVGISQSATQITLLFITPPAPPPAGGVANEPTDVTMVTRRDGQIVVDRSGSTA